MQIDVILMGILQPHIHRFEPILQPRVHMALKETFFPASVRAADKAQQAVLHKWLHVGPCSIEIGREVALCRTLILIENLIGMRERYAVNDVRGRVFLFLHDGPSFCDGGRRANRDGAREEGRLLWAHDLRVFG